MPKSKKREAASEFDIQEEIKCLVEFLNTKRVRYSILPIRVDEAYDRARPLIEAAPKLLERLKDAILKLELEGYDDASIVVSSGKAAIKSAEPGGK